MDLETIARNALAVQRAEDLRTSPQLTLSELILKMEAVSDHGKPVVYDDGYAYPDGIDSWRGSYSELALGWSMTGAGGTPSSVAGLLAILRGAVARTFEGYKGGEYLMGENTPVWVANYGEAEGFRVDDDGNSQAVVEVAEHEQVVSIVTRLLPY